MTIKFTNEIGKEIKERGTEKIERSYIDKESDKKYKVDRNILVFAFRYALGRMSMAPSIAIDNMEYNIKSINTEDLKLFIKETKEYENYGMNIDKVCWLNFINSLEEEIKNR